MRRGEKEVWAPSSDARSYKRESKKQTRTILSTIRSRSETKKRNQKATSSTHIYIHEREDKTPSPDDQCSLSIVHGRAALGCGRAPDLEWSGDTRAAAARQSTRRVVCWVTRIPEVFTWRDAQPEVSRGGYGDISTPTKQHPDASRRCATLWTWRTFWSHSPRCERETKRSRKSW